MKTMTTIVSVMMTRLAMTMMMRKNEDKTGLATTTVIMIVTSN